MEDIIKALEDNLGGTRIQRTIQGVKVVYRVTMVGERAVKVGDTWYDLRSFIGTDEFRTWLMEKVTKA